MIDKILSLIQEFISAFQIWITVNAWQGGVILRRGRFLRMAHRGVNWLLPFWIDQAHITTQALETFIAGPQSLTTADGKPVIITSVVTFRVSDPKTFLLEVNGANRVLEDSTFGEVASAVAGMTWEELISSSLGAFLTRKLRRRARRYGLRVVRVQIVDLTLSRSIRLLQSMTTSYSAEKEF